MVDKHTKRSYIVFTSTAVVAVFAVLALFFARPANKENASKENAVAKDVVKDTVAPGPEKLVAKSKFNPEQLSDDDELLLKVFQFYCWDAHDPVWQTEEHKQKEKNFTKEIMGRDVLWHVKVIGFNNPDYNGFTIIFVVPDAPHQRTLCEPSTIEVDYDSRLPRYQSGARLTVRGTISDVFPVRVNAHEIAETKLQAP
ncbi:MAG TPA: hypothetical protein VMJ32_15500 [Pirellulales bacterium]|nr:hypothetical protein [Pirellulales bacterium]